MENKEIMMTYNKGKNHTYIWPITIKIKSFSITLQVAYHQFSPCFLMLRGCEI